ncbi:MAG TPA: hypothetical protein VK138_12005 [Acidiferrobacterales bacterium]|nr:hypothetical protein [Acidiferrobacterales bacterium]
MMKPLSVEAFLQEATLLYFNELGCDPIRPRYWPSYFRHVGRNMEWPTVCVCNVIRKSDSEYWMVVFGYEPSAEDICVHYFNQDLIFRSLIPPVPFNNDPFVNTAIRALKKVKAMPEWQKIIKKIIELPTMVDIKGHYA